MSQVVFSQTITDHYGRSPKLEICIGDILDCQGETVDFLVMSAFPNDYAKTENSLVGRLSGIGVDVKQLSRNKGQDMRKRWLCWVSRELKDISQPIGRLVCFENDFDQLSHFPKQNARQSPADVVGNVFRSVREFLMSDLQCRARLVRVPQLATGDQGHDELEMLRAIVRQSFVHLQFCGNTDKIQIFLRPGTPLLQRLLVEAGLVIQECRSEFPLAKYDSQYDYFISYRHVDSDIKDLLVGSIRKKQPNVKLFIDSDNLEPGQFWKPALLRAMASSRQTICLVTDSYPDASECMDEFHMACNFNSQREGFLRPILSLCERDISSLSGSMSRIHWENRGFPPDFSGWA